MIKVWLFRTVIRLSSWFNWRGSKPQNLAVRDITIDNGAAGMALRIYTPETGTEPRRAIVYYHGGGFVLGDLNSQDATCRQLCVSCDAVVVSVDYRLAPENPFPAAANDAITALRWLHDNAATIGVDAARIFVAGDSAGGNLAAVVAQQARQFAPAGIRGQVLIYPVTHHADFGTDSYDTYGQGYLLTRDMMAWFWRLYLKNETLPDEGVYTHELATPLATGDLSNLPPAILIIAGQDPLRDEGVAYGEAMQAQGIAVQTSEYADQQHGFVGTGGPGESNDAAIAEIAVWVKAIDS